MRNLAKIVAAGIVLLATVGSVSAADAWKPFVEVTLPHDVVDLGCEWGPGVKRLAARLCAHVVSNCPYHLAASFQGFRHAGGKAVMSPADLRVAINGHDASGGAKKVPIASSRKPTPGGVDVPVNLRVAVKGLEYYPAGQYNGILRITVMAGP